jgi:glyoxylase-like metal-dependent hydrolase (beta-lactamase superfamily II)
VISFSFAAVVLALASPADAPAAPFVQVPQAVAPHVTLLHLPATYFIDPTGNVEVIEQRDGLIVIDSGGYFGAGQRVVKMVKAISPKPVKALVLTHYHSDHSFGAPAILAAWPKAEFIASEGTYKAMAEGRPPGAPRRASKEFEQARLQRMRDQYARLASQAGNMATREEKEGLARELASFSTRYADFPGTYTILPRRTFKHRLDFPDREAPVRLLFLGRANTPGDTLAWLPKQRILITGDIVVAPVPYMLDVYPGEMLDVFRRMRALDFRLLIPGHGAPQQRAYLDRLEAMVRDVRARVGPLASKKLTSEQIEKRLDGAHWRRIFAGSDSWLGSWFENYTWNPLVESAVQEARSERLGPPPVNP